MTRAQRLGRVLRWTGNGLTLLIGVAAFIALVSGEGLLGGVLIVLGAVPFILGQGLSHILKEPRVRLAKRQKGKTRGK